MTHLRKRRDQRGAAVVEFAIIAPILFLLVFGLIDFGFIFNDYLSVRNGVQNGARLGAVANFGTLTPATSSCVLTPTAPTTSSEAIELMCETKDRIGLNQTNTRVKILTVDPASAGCPSSCTNAYSDGNEIVVCAQFPVTSRSKILSPFTSGKTITTRVAARVETTSYEKASPPISQPAAGTVGVGDLTSAAETSLPGTDWSFCTG